MYRILFLAVFSGISLMNGCAQNSAVIDMNATHQLVRGFGAANIVPWRPDMTAEETGKAFGTGDGQIGLSILRLRIPCDRSEFALNVPTAKRAYDLGVTIIASPWTPPPFMKSSNNIVGGYLLEEYYDDYALHLHSFVEFMSENGVHIYAVSVQNEPDVKVTYESCDWNSRQMVKFIGENAQSIGTKVMAPEASQFRVTMSDPILNDPAACANLDIVAGHIYGGGPWTYPPAEDKGKEIWMTEHLVLETSWFAVLSTGIEINKCMQAGMNAYIWWYLVRFYGLIFDNGEDERTPAGAVKGGISKRGYVMSQFARFVRPGFYKIECSAGPQAGVSLTAYRNDSSSRLVLVAINTDHEDKIQEFVIRGGSFKSSTPYVTSETKDCAKETDIPISGGKLSARLEARSITTYTMEADDQK